MTLISTENVKKYCLENGLTVLLEVNRASPVISINVGVKVGSAWETPDEAGLSHLLEHMVFKGTPSFKPGEIAHMVEASGGELNAYTSFDQTVYYINLAATHWQKGLKAIQEMAFEAQIDPVELEREKEVVLEEIRRGKDNPHHVLSEALFGLAFKQHPYGRPVIGFEESVRSFSPEKVLEYYHRWYVPNNMVLGICGDFDGATLEAAISQQFGSFSKRDILRPVIADEPLPQTASFKKTTSKIQGFYLALAFPAPSFKHPDVAALDLLSHLLGGSPTSRLEQIVKEQKKLVQSAHSYSYNPYFPGLFIIEALTNDKSVSHVGPALFEEIAFLQNHPSDTEALSRAKLNIKSSVYYEKETCEGTARKWMVLETIAGDFRYEEKYLASIDQVTPADIQRVAKSYLNQERFFSVVLHPQDKKISLPSLRTLKNTGKLSSKKYTLVGEWDGIQSHALPNGITIVSRENHRLPLISLRAAFLGGVRFENKKTNGLTSLMTRVLEKGTTSKDRVKIAEINELMAGHLDSFAGRNSWGLASSFLAEKQNLGLELFCDVMTHPSFDANEFEKEKRQTLEAIKNQEDSLSHWVFQKFQSLLYTRHPYGLPTLGTKKSVLGLKRNHLINYYQKALHPRHLVISAAGDFKTSDLLDAFSKNLGSLKNPKNWFQAPAKDQKPKTIREAMVRKQKMQAHLVLGFMGTTLKNHDRYAFEVLNNILSGQGGRLFLELRDKQSLAYSVTSNLNEGLEPGFFAVYIGSEPGKLDQALSGIKLELQKIQMEPVSQAELERAIHYIVGNYELDLQKNSSVASAMAFYELYGQGQNEFKNYPKKIEAVTANDVLAVAKKYLDLNAYTLAVIKP